MHDQVKWYATSLVVHLGLLALILALAANAVTCSPPISIDFTFSTCPVSDQPPENPKQQAAAQQQPVAAQNPEPVQHEQARSEPQPIPVISQNSNPQPPAAPTPSAPPASSAVTGTVTSLSSSTPAPSTVTLPRSAQSGEEGVALAKAQQRYLKEHFTYIRDLIIQRLTYPQLARRMGWSGRVVLAFVVAEDGSVCSIHVKESSGYPVLDNSAIQTVKNVAPFPRPPVVAEIVMPVLFRLQ